ncbi:VOC family protein [Halocynthiibacter sp. C4]|uniref:VOC family protein n=1 Tax=Halocynthiibacter sp. C4 TaxID=2992758 RepID=UPI00237C19B6|nr:VOC family protein [Halocynthiibacter sp. C4]MDE0589971.1 VOC family protein [Halocynthiibacter sp. C4]
MQLGTFSLSLSVQDLAKSRAFYEKLGFEIFHGAADQGWLILKNGDVTLGLFQGMFERNMLTFNPGWAADASPLEKFTDVRELQKTLLDQGINVETSAGDGTGPASFIVHDPDGNPILFDQHVDAPE